MPGAEGWFLGDFSFVYGATEEDPILIEGMLHWLLYANDAWEATGEDDCQLSWIAGGARIPSDNCSACTYLLDLQLTLDFSLTDCPDELYEGTEAEFSFWGSGDFFANGEANDARAWLAQGPACNWF